MFAYAGASRREVEALYQALKNSSACDPTAKVALTDCDGWHKDGWGYVIRTANELFHYRTQRPLSEDTHTFPAFEGNILAIFHARLSSGPLGDAAFSHPFVGANQESIFYFAHNGGLKGPAKENPDKVDSEWAFEQIVAKNGMTPVLQELKDNTRSALNLLLLTITRKTRKASLEYLNFYTTFGDAEKDGYYRMYQATMPEGGKAVFSSTLRDHLDVTPQPVPYGEVEMLG
jgi:predicted glutamine amidotransferase